jgi:hypothetical protein
MANYLPRTPLVQLNKLQEQKSPKKLFLAYEGKNAAIKTSARNTKDSNIPEASALKNSTTTEQVDGSFGKFSVIAICAAIVIGISLLY